MFYSEFASSQTFKLSQDDAVKIFENLIHLKPIKCTVAILEGKEYIFCLADKTGTESKSFLNPEISFYKLSKFADVWRVETRQDVFKEEAKYCEFLNNLEIVTVDNEPYLYFIYGLVDEGNGSGDIEMIKFSLYSLKTYRLVSLDDEGYASYDIKGNFQFIKDGNFLNVDSLKSQKNYLDFLEDKAAKSNLIYHPSKKDLDLNDPDNYEKKWTIDNPKIADEVLESNKTSVYNEPLSITYYNKNLFLKNVGSIANQCENTNYKFKAYFRGSIIGYDKQKKKYFPIWVESCMHGCNKEVSFINPITLKIHYTEADDRIIKINLIRMTYSTSYEIPPVEKPIATKLHLNKKPEIVSTFTKSLFLNKSQLYIQEEIKKQNGWHYLGSETSDLGGTTIGFSCVYKPGRSFPFQATYSYWIDTDSNTCIRTFIGFPSVYLKFMLSKLNGYNLVDDTDFESNDGKINVNLSRNGNQTTMECHWNN